MDELFQEVSEMAATYAAQTQRDGAAQSEFERYWAERQSVEVGRKRLNSEEWRVYEQTTFAPIVPKNLPSDETLEGRVARQQIIQRANATQFRSCPEFEFFKQADRDGKTFYQDVFSHDPGVYVPAEGSK